MRTSCLSFRLLGLVLAIGFDLPEAAAQAQIEATGPPPGFDDLLAPQTTVVDVYFGGQPVGSALATFAPGIFSFDDPFAVTQLIPGVASPTQVERSLTGELDPHPELVCGATNLEDCGVLEPETAGVIFDSGRFQVDVFVNSSLLAIQATDVERFLAPPDTGFSGITALAGAASGASGEEDQFNLRNRSIVAFRDARVRLDSSLSSDDDLIFDTAFAEHDQPGRRFAGGLFRTQGIELVGEEKIVGGYVGTSFDTRADLDQVSGTQLTVFLPRRSQVEIIREGRLISSQLLEAGNQALDTSLLPNGAYDVTLRIREIGGGDREEIRFFVKSLAIPPKDSPIFFLEGGMRVDDIDPDLFPDVTDTPLLRAGTTHRITDGLALGGGFITSDEQALLEAKALHVSRFAQINLAGIATTDEDLGVSASIAGRLGDFNYSLTGRRVWAGETVVAAAVDNEEFDPIVQSFEEARGSLAYRLGDITLGFQGNFREDSQADSTSFSFGPTLSYRIFQDRRFNVTLRAEAARTQDEDVAFARLRFRFNSPRWRATATGGYRAEHARSSDTSEDSGVLADGSLTWRDQQLVPGDLSVTASAFREPDLNTLQLGSDYASRLGRYSVAGAVEDRDNETETRYSATGALNWLTTPTDIVLGGRDTLESAVIVAIGGTAEDTEFEVLIDNRPNGTLRSGQRLPIALPPYETYDIRVRPSSGALVDFDAKARSVTLYPGNVARVAWDVHPLRAIYGRALGPDGEPIAFSRMLNVVGDAVSDDLGYFQAEIGGGGPLVFRRPDGTQCAVALGELPADQDLISLGTVTCQ